MCNRFSNSNCISNGPGTAFHSGAHEFIYGLSGVCVAQSLVCFLLFCGSCFSFCPFFLYAIVLAVLLQLPAAGDPFDIFTLFFNIFCYICSIFSFCSRLYYEPRNMLYI